VRGRSGLVAASRAAGHDLLHCCRSRPWFNMIRYFGVLSSHSRHRARVVPSRVDPARFAPEPAEGDQLEFAFPGHAAPTPTRGRSRWGWLLRHVFRAQVETCCRCGGPMRWVEAATEPTATARLLAKHGLAPQPPSRTTTADGPGSAPASLRLRRAPRASGEFGPSELEAEVHPTTTRPTGIAYPLGRRRGPELVAEPSLLLPGCQQPLTPPAWLGDLPSPLSETAVRSSCARW
jgi:hypothetical protein